jgi:hypothetical protein
MGVAAGGGGVRWQAGGRQQQALQEGIRCGGTPIRSPRRLSAPALLGTRAGDAGG